MVSQILKGLSPPPQTPGHAPGGWTRLTLPRGGEFLARRAADGWDVLPVAPRLDRGATGQPLVSLTLVLTRPPAGNETIEPLIASGSLALTCSFSMSDDECRALEGLLRGRCRPYFVRSASSELRGSGNVYARAAPLGAEPRWWLGVSLPAKPAVEVLAAFRRQVIPGSPLRVTTELREDHAPVIEDATLAELLGGLLDGQDPGRFLTMVSVARDGGLAPVPPLRRSAAGASRALAGSAPMLAAGGTLQALPAAMATQSLSTTPAAALVASTTSSVAVQLSPNAQLLVAGDAIVHGPILDDEGEEDVPKAHLPMTTNAGAPYWLDALDSAVAFYAPGFASVPPAPSDDPASSAFSFIYAKSGPVLGGNTALQAGLAGSVRITVAPIIPEVVKTAIAAVGGLVPKPVPLNNLTCALEISYRQSGSAGILVQRFPGTVARQDDRIVCTVDLLDDWVRLAYAGLATGAASGLPSPRLIVDYSFQTYAWVFVGRVPVPDRFEQRPEFFPVGGGIVSRIPSVEKRADLPQRIDRPTLVREDFSVVGAASFSQYRLERPGVRPRDIPAMRLQAGIIGSVRPPLAPIIARRRRLVIRTMVRSEGVPLSFPCEATGNLYLERGANGTTTAVGCQDSLRLGETAVKAFQEVPELAEPAFRVWRSLQQPGRFMVVPTTYRVGRYGAVDGDKAYRPMIALFGALDPDPDKNRYVLSATLVPNVSRSALARLNTRLADHSPARAARSIVFPTDPFVGVKAAFSWAAPATTDPPQTMTIVDAISATFSMALTDSLIFMAMINRTGLHGVATFTLPDGTALQCGLAIDDEIIGPSETGPVTATVSGISARLRNMTMERMNVTGLVEVEDDGTSKTIPLAVALEPAGETDVPIDAEAMAAYVDASPAEHRKIEEMNVFVEDVTTTVTFLTQIALVNHGLNALRARARLKGETHFEEVELGDGVAASVTFTLPITSYLERRILQYSLTKIIGSAPAVDTDWRDWDLENGVMIGITADLL